MNEAPTISDIYYKLGGLESKIDSVLMLQKADTEILTRRLDGLEAWANELEDRTVELETSEAKRAGMLVVLSAVFSMVATVLSAGVSKLFASIFP